MHGSSQREAPEPVERNRRDTRPPVPGPHRYRQDATYIGTSRSEEARYSYKGERSVEAFVSLWSEADLVVDIQVRSGNVSPKSDQLARLKESLSRLPESVKKVSLRSDSAGYQEEVLRYCAEGKNERFGVIEFAISCPVWKEFHREAIRLPEEAWKVVEGTTDREYAEVPFVPNSLGTSASGPDYRYIAIRRKLADAERLKEKAVEMQGQRYLFDDTELSRLHATEFPGGTYAIFGLVTNRTGMDGSELVHWHDARCGKGEQIHDDLKNGLGMGHVTSVELGATRHGYGYRHSRTTSVRSSGIGISAGLRRGIARRD